MGKLPETAEWAPFQEHFRTLRFRPRERRSETAGSGPTVVNEPRCGLAPYRVDESRVRCQCLDSSDVRLIVQRQQRQPMRSARDTMIPSGPRT